MTRYSVPFFLHDYDIADVWPFGDRVLLSHDKKRWQSPSPSCIRAGLRGRKAGLELMADSLPGEEDGVVSVSDVDLGRAKYACRR
jgi:hypothetical protein